MNGVTTQFKYYFFLNIDYPVYLESYGIISFLQMFKYQYLFIIEMRNKYRSDDMIYFSL